MAENVLRLIHMMIGAAVFGPMAAAPIGWLIGRCSKIWRDRFVYIVCGLEQAVLAFLFVLAWQGLQGGFWILPGICGRGLVFTVDGFRVLYGLMAAFLWFVTTVFSREYFKRYRNRNRYYFFWLATLGATEGVFLSQDFFTLFIFFELMSFASFAWVAQDEREESLRAANTYLAVAVISGMVMLMGLFLYYGASEEYRFAAGLCMLVGFGAKAGAFPLHIWLPKAHPVAPAPASALLSGVLTKAGVFGVLLLTSYEFPGVPAWGELVLTVGVITMVMGALLALFSVDLKRTLACSSVSQIGFILLGVGMAGILGEDGMLAIQGSILHMVNHSLLKLVLFLAAGVVFMNTHKLNLNDIRGFGRGKPLLAGIFLMGAFGISGVPLWNGYVSKTLLHESILERMDRFPAYQRGVEWAFLISGGLTVAYMTKLYVAIFIERNPDARLQKQYDDLGGKYMNRASAAVLAFSAVLPPLFGMCPELIMGRLADMGASTFAAEGVLAEATLQIEWFSMENLKGAGISIGIGVLVYLFLVRTWLMGRRPGEGKIGTDQNSGGRLRKSPKIYLNRWYRWFDLERVVYRPVLLKALPFVLGVFCRAMDSGVDAMVVFLRKTLLRDSKLPGELEEGTMFTHVAGEIANWMQETVNRTFRRKHPENVDYEHKFALIHQEWSEDSRIVARSLSFGLLLFCAGLLLTVLYLLSAG